jgi:hypothetical protein
MSSFNVDPAPTQKEIFAGTGRIVDGHGWTQWFARGVSSISNDEIQQKVVYQGRIATFWAKLGPKDLQNVTITLPTSFEDTVLQVWDGSSLVGGALVSGKTVTLPSITTQNDTYILGTLLARGI